MQSQTATSQAVFVSAILIFNSVQTHQGTLRARYEYGTHQAAIEQQQITTGSQLFKAFAPFPQQPILRLKRDFPLSQEELPLPAPSAFFERTAYLVSTTTQTPVIQPAFATLPQYPLDQAWSAVYPPLPAPSSVPPSPAAPVFVVTYPQQFGPLDVAMQQSDIFQPIGQTGPVAISLVPPTILGLEDPGVDPTTLLGKAQLRWAAVPGASAYRVYVNGVPQNPPIMGQSFLATGLVVGQQYKFAVVAVAAGIDDSPLSNEIYYEHGSNEFSVVYTYPWGNTFKTGYVLVVKLGTPV